jgi:arabinose-5-phosphate isomerase
MSIHSDKFKIAELMMDLEDFPVIYENTILKEALDEMDKFHLGVACIINLKGQLLGIITDGDIRRKLSLVQKPLSFFFMDDAILHAIVNPITITKEMSITEATNLMNKKKIWDLPVIENNCLVGMLHMHSLARALINTK